jgi:hypothetical protein
MIFVLTGVGVVCFVLGAFFGGWVMRWRSSRSESLPLGIPIVRGDGDEVQPGSILSGGIAPDHIDEIIREMEGRGAESPSLQGLPDSKLAKDLQALEANEPPDKPKR